MLDVAALAARRLARLAPSGLVLIPIFDGGKDTITSCSVQAIVGGSWKEYRVPTTLPLPFARANN